MLHCLHFYRKPSTQLFRTFRLKAFSEHGIRNYSDAISSRRIISAAEISVLKRCLHSTSTSGNVAVTQEQSLYESNALPKSARVVICGGGIMGGK